MRRGLRLRSRFVRWLRGGPGVGADLLIVETMTVAGRGGNR